ncbi:MAG: NADH-quinone oxidoreductase subunit J [Parachlamydiaceae bacterium]
MVLLANPIEWILGCVLVLSALGVILATKPVHASLSFLMTLLVLAAIYLQLSAQFIAVMQVLVYAGAILVLFVFVIVLFQDAHEQIATFASKSAPLLLFVGVSAFLLTMIFLGKQFLGMAPAHPALPHDYGTVQSLGRALYVDFFFPFEAVTLLFLIAGVGALYIGRKVK